MHWEASIPLLWDIGLKPGLSVRTIKESVEAAQNDQTIMTSLTEIRLINGSTILFEALKAEIVLDKIWPADQFFAAKMQEQQQRYRNWLNTASCPNLNMPNSSTRLKCFGEFLMRCIF